MEYLARKDPRKIIESMFSIVDKSGKQVPFIFNEPQAQFYDKRTSRDDILKARKEGFSSMVLAILTVNFLFVPNMVCAAVSHRENDTKRFLDKVKYFIETLPFKVTLSKDTEEQLRIEEMNSVFIIGTAGSKTFARGDTIMKLLLSEFAFYPSWEMVTGLTNSVPDDLENTWIIKETTANGYGNPHHSAWIDEKRGNSVYTPHFFSWADAPEYRMKIDENTKFSEEERKLQETYNLSDEQLKWRQWKVNSMQPTQDYSKEELFKQEFPLTDTEAFLSTGRPVFNPETLDWYEQAICMEPLKRGDLVGWSPPFFQEDSLGPLRIYKQPVAYKKYVLSGDVAEEGDYSTLIVLDKEQMEVQAVWWGHTDEFELAKTAYRLGEYYNFALVGIERNNMGVAVVKKLDELGYRNQYRTEIIDELGKKVKDKLGWETNAKTRPIMLSDLVEIVNGRLILIRDKNIIGELKSFIRGKKGKPEAQVGTHDDLVMGLAIAYQLYKVLPVAIDDDEVIIRSYKPNTTLANFSNKNK